MGNGNPPVSMMSAILAGISGVKVGLDDIPAVCGTGNCTFEAYSTLGVCADWSDITHLMTSTNIDNSPGFFDDFYTLPNGHYVEQDSFHYLNITTLANLSLAFPAATNPLASIYLIYHDIAIEAMIQLCVLDLKTQTSNSKTTTTVISANKTSKWDSPYMRISSSSSTTGPLNITDHSRVLIEHALVEQFLIRISRGWEHYHRYTIRAGFC